MTELLEKIEAVVKAYPFATEVLMLIVGVILGAISTAIINNLAVRKKAKFDMQYQIVKDEAENVANIYYKIEAVEIDLPNEKGNTKLFFNEIEEIQSLLLSLNSRLCNKRKFVRKYISALMIEKSAKYVLDYKNIFYEDDMKFGFNFKIIPQINAEGIRKLRKLKDDFQELSDEMTEALERVIEPGIISRFKRKLRNPIMGVEKISAMMKLNKCDKKGK